MGSENRAPASADRDSVPRQEPDALASSSCSRASSCRCSSRRSRTTCSRRAASRERSSTRRSAPAVYGIWSSTLFGSGGAIQWQRWQGTLELLVAAPAPFILRPPAADARDLDDRRLLAGRDPASGAGSRSGSRSTSSSRSRSCVACRRRSSASACSGCCSRRRSSSTGNANALSNMLEWPVLLVTGMLVPLSLLPGWAHPIAWVLAPTWGVAGDPRGGARRNALAGPIGMTARCSARSTSRSGRSFLAPLRASPRASRRPSR